MFPICTSSFGLKETKEYQRRSESHRIRKLLQSINEARPAGQPDIHYFIKENFSEYLHEFNYDNFRLVKEECCADERNTY